MQKSILLLVLSNVSSAAIGMFLYGQDPIERKLAIGFMVTTIILVFIIENCCLRPFGSSSLRSNKQK